MFKATALAGAAHLVLDAVASRLPWTTPPYLLLDYASESFRDLLFLDRRTLLVAVAVISAGVNGAIAGLFATALAGARRRVVAIGASLSALWVFSGGLMTIVYLSPPAAIVAVRAAHPLEGRVRLRRAVDGGQAVASRGNGSLVRRAGLSYAPRPARP